MDSRAKNGLLGQITVNEFAGSRAIIENAPSEL